METWQQLTIAELWAAIVSIIALLLICAKFFKDVFGIEAFGKKIYRGAPMIWKWFMASTIFRHDMNKAVKQLLEEQKRVRKQLEFNGGSSLMDAVVRVERGQVEMREDIKYINARLGVRDMFSESLVFRLGNDGSCVFINDAFLKKFGYSEADIKGFNFENTIHSEDVDHVRNKWQRAIEKKATFYDEHRIWDIHGKLHDCIIKAYPLLDSDGALKEFYGTVEIIT